MMNDKGKIRNTRKIHRCPSRGRNRRIKNGVERLKKSRAPLSVMKDWTHPPEDLGWRGEKPSQKEGELGKSYLTLEECPRKGKNKRESRW